MNTPELSKILSQLGTTEKQGSEFVFKCRTSDTYFTEDADKIVFPNFQSNMEIAFFYGDASIPTGPDQPDMFNLLGVQDGIIKKCLDNLTVEEGQPNISELTGDRKIICGPNYVDRQRYLAAQEAVSNGQVVKDLCSNPNLFEVPIWRDWEECLLLETPLSNLLFNYVPLELSRSKEGPDYVTTHRYTLYAGVEDFSQVRIYQYNPEETHTPATS